MIKEVYCEVGCYLDLEIFKGVVTYPDSWSEEQMNEALIDDLYQMAKESTEGWYGSHGFGEEDEEDEEVIIQEVEEACEYWWRPWTVEDEGSCTYTYGMDVREFDYMPD